MRVQSLLLFVTLVSAAADISLEISAVGKPAIKLNAAELRSMPRTKAAAADHTYEGVTLYEILKRAGQPMGEELRGPLLTRFVVISAHDGYRALFSLPELDPVFGNNGAIVADTLDGHALPDNRGPLMIVVPGEKRHARWVNGVERIEVLSAPAPVH